MNWGAWRATVRGVAKSQTRLKQHARASIIIKQILASYLVIVHIQSMGAFAVLVYKDFINNTLTGESAEDVLSEKGYIYKTIHLMSHNNAKQ